jgi:hypothetical protein
MMFFASGAGPPTASTREHTFFQWNLNAFFQKYCSYRFVFYAFDIGRVAYFMVPVGNYKFKWIPLADLEPETEAGAEAETIIRLRLRPTVSASAPTQPFGSLRRLLNITAMYSNC